MLFRNHLPLKNNRIAITIVIALGIIVSLSISCNAQPPEEAALSSLRRLTKEGILPAEAVVADIESRYAGTATAALARLLRGRIRLENGNPAGAAQLLDTDIFADKTGVADYALWLRIKALIESNQDTLAEKAFNLMLEEHPGSLRVRNARLVWADRLQKKGDLKKMMPVLQPLIDADDPDALILVAAAHEKSLSPDQANAWYRRLYFYAAGSKAGGAAERWLTERGQVLTPKTKDEILTRANDLFRRGIHQAAAAAYDDAIRIFPGQITPGIQLRRLTAHAKARQMIQAKAAYSAINPAAKEIEEARYHLVLALARNRSWDEVRSLIDELRQNSPNSDWTPKAIIDVGMTARDQRRKSDEAFYLKTAVENYPEAIDVTKAQFELAWLEHQNKNYAVSAKMLIEHLARYVDKDNSYRGRAGYWAARDSERAGMIDEACALYDAVVYRYGSNWYGYLGLDRLLALRRNGRCQKAAKFTVDSLVPKAVENLKVITVAAETATARELERAKKSEELSVIGLFDWAIDELQWAGKTADNSPKINLALAKHFRLKGDNVRALLALAKSYPDYAQMFPEEMGREEWDIFYPLIHWNDVKYWAGQRRLDPYQVAGLIRQETIFDPDAKSSANAYGLMQLLVPTARTMARKYSSVDSNSISGPTLFNPRLNIELGTAYMREQLDRYGRIEYMSVAYNAGPGRMVRWRNELPSEIDEFVEEIPFSETRGYVQGVIRNSAQYRRLYELNGSFKPNVGKSPLRAQIDSRPAEEFAKEHPDIDVRRVKTARE